jgi:tetratricopeptide (TPR) repeat protein/class 3 adenylate cyclase
VKNLIPPFIYEQSKNGKTHGRFEAYTMFIDLSGFTALTQTLMKRGNKGAEQLSIILNDIFAPMVELVYSSGGIIPYFAGDAFTGVFPLTYSNMDANSFLDTAQQMRALFGSDDSKKNQFGDFNIGIKIGLSVGEVEWGIIGEDYKQFYFRGEAIDDCAECEHHATDQDIILNYKIRNAFADRTKIQLLPIEDDFFKLMDEVSGDYPVARKNSIPAIERSVLSSFFPDSVIDFNQMGEFRNVVTVFISFTGVDNHESLDEFSTIVLNQINSFSGYFKEIDFGDKGGLMLGFFGAPVSYENNVERALEFLLSVQEEVQSLKGLGLEIRSGISSGIAYAGIVGGYERTQYAIVGSEVNLAARLMIAAKWGEILVDEHIQKSRLYHFMNLGKAKYKGIEGEVQTYQFLGRKTEGQPIFSGEMIGREKELESLAVFANTVLENRYPGIAYVFGEAGIGKSRLSFELKKAIQKDKKVNWFTCPADQILRKPFNPFIAQLKDFFEQSSNNTAEQNQNNFENNFDWLSQALEQKEGADARNITKEVKRTKSILAAQIGIFYPNSLWSKLDARGRYQNTLIAFNNYITGAALVSPLVLEVEDGHWYDADSIDLLNELAPRFNEYPIFVLVTSRYNDDGTKPLLFNAETIQENEITVEQLDLNILSESGLRTFAEEKLGGPVHDTFHAYLVKTSNGNPFYLEQILAYFEESNLLIKEDGLWSIEESTIKLPSSMNAVLTARIDRLSTLVKETVKAAAVIGREFELPILTEVMLQNEAFVEKNGNVVRVLKEQVQTAEQGQIWSALSELRYMFKHSLMRETVYDMQLHTRLRKLHLFIGSAIEKIYLQTIEEKYVDLAFHYGQAEVKDKTTEYLEKAADFARDNFQNRQAIEFYEKLEDLLKEKGDQKHLVNVLLKKGPVLELIGEWDASEKAYRSAFDLIEELKDEILQGRVSNDIGRILLLKGQYDEAKTYLERANNIFNEIDDPVGKFRVLGDLGNFYFRQGNYEEAQIRFNDSIEKSKSIPYNSSFSKIVSSLGLTHMNLGNFRQGIDCQLDALKICEQEEDRQGTATLHTNLGIVYYEKGDLEDALMHYKQGLEISTDLGNKQLTAIATGCIGTVYQHQGKFELALINYIEDLKLCRELGDKQGTAIAYGLIGELKAVEGDFDAAIPYLQEQMSLSKELGYLKGVAKALNVLGDIYFLRKDLEQSLEHYQKAVELSRSIDNIPVLGMSLVEQGFVFVKLKESEKALAVLTKVEGIADNLDNPDLRFGAVILKAEVLALQGGKEEAVQLLESKLSGVLSREEEAAIHYELFKLNITGNIHQKKAFELYESLYEKIPKFLFKQRIDELNPSA